MINKKCDYCEKEIEVKGSADYQFSEFALFHFKKRRDFCNFNCLKEWINVYQKENINKKLFEEVKKKMCKEDLDLIK